MPRFARRARRRGFTLLEVMVAVAILGVALTAVFSAEAGAIRMAARARLLTTASLLARCKMAELEEHLLKDGLPAVSETGTDECCEEGEVEGFECDWELSRVVLPDQAPIGEEGPIDVAGAAGSESHAGQELGSSTALTGAPDPNDIMSGAMLGGGGDPVSEMAMSIAFPIIKPMLEEQVRRARVTVRWGEGQDEQSFDVIQYVVAEQIPAAITQQAATEAQNAMGNPTNPQPTGQQQQQGQQQQGTQR